MDHYSNAMSLSFSREMSIVSESAIRKAQHIVGVAMGACLALWFVPLSGIACNVAEKKMVRQLLSILGSDTSDAAADDLFWFCRKKLLVVNGATYIPFAGTSFQLIEVYALGQFTIHCATHYSDVANEQHLGETWRAIEGEVFSGARVVSSYEEFTGEQFPDAIKRKFIPAVDIIRNLYMRAERLPFVEGKQEKVGEAIRVAVNVGTAVGKDLLRSVIKRIKHVRG